ncbi:MAG: PadR family transcriptional regulator [Candidatus Hodarchaeota archaeon]
MTETPTDRTLEKLREWTREINRGILEFWVLNLLRREKAQYGMQIANLIEEMSEGRIQLEPGTIYPLLNRLAKSGWIIIDDNISSQGRGPVRRYYRLTDEGTKLLNAMIDHYFETYDALFQLMAAQFRSVRTRLSEMMEDFE